MYFIRINDHEGYADAIREHFCDYTDVVAVKHTGKYGDNPHFHIAVKSHLKRPTLRARLVKVFDQGKGNEHMSIKEIQPGAFKNTVQYMFHEENRESFEVLLGNEEVCEEARQGAIKYKQDNREKSLKEQKKTREPTFTEKVVDAAVEHFRPGGLLMMHLKRDHVLKFIVGFFGNNKKVFDKFIIIRIYNVVAYHLWGNSFVNEIVADIEQQMA